MTDRLFRRIVNLLRPARTTTATTESGTVQTVQAQFSQFETHDVVSAQQFGVASALPIGTDLLVANLRGDNSIGVSLASNHQPSRPTGLGSGQTCIYDTNGTRILLDAAGNITITAGQSVSITSPTVSMSGMAIAGNGLTVSGGSVVIKAGSLTVTGDISATGTISAPEIRGHVN